MLNHLFARADELNEDPLHGFLAGRVLRDGTIMPRQIMLYREFVRTAFSPA